MQGMDDVGIKTATAHHKKDAVIRPAGIAMHDGPVNDGFRTLLRRRSEPEMPCEQVLVSGGKDGQRNAWSGPIDEFGGSAISADPDKSPKLALLMQSVALCCHFVEVRQDVRFQPAFLEKPS
jgi:hypothetical protein